MLDYAAVRPGGKAADVPLDELILEMKRAVIRMTEAAGGGYLAQGLGSAEVIAALFYRTLRLDPEHPEWDNRDRFLLSVGHYAMAVYAALARLGYFEERLLDSYSADGSMLEMIGSERTPGFEITGGSLSQGLSQGVGLAMAAKLRNYPWRTIVYMSDGELEEGQTWEAAMVAAHHQLDNVLAIVDVNGMQADGRIEEVTGLLPIADKWHAFGWQVTEIDGNNIEEVMHALRHAVPAHGKPTIIVAHTVMGNGVSSLHGKPDVHYVKWSREQSEQAWAELCHAGSGGGKAT